MKFTSYISVAYLAIFLPAAILIYGILPKKARPFFLLVANLLFFWFISEWLIAYLIVSILSIYLIALWLERMKKARANALLSANSREEKKSIKAKSQKKQLLIKHPGI